MRRCLSTIYHKYLKLIGIAGITVLALGAFVPVLKASQYSDIAVSVIIVPDNFIPGQVTGLAVMPGVTEGSINVSWTAPHEDGTVGGAVQTYSIRYATFGINGVSGNTTFWWNHPGMLTALYSGSPKQPGENETLIMGGLTPGATLYFSIKSKDDANNESLIDAKSAGLDQACGWVKRVPPSAVTDLTAVKGTGNDEVNLAWTAPGDDGWAGQAVEYTIKYATFTINEANFEAVAAKKQRAVTVPGLSGDSDTISGLSSGVTYYFAIKTKDDADNLSAVSNTAIFLAGDSVPPSKPQGLQALAGDGKATLTWTANPEPDLAGYNVYHSTYGLGYSTVPVNTALITDNTFEHSGLANGATCYYVITAVDANGNESAYSVEVTVVPADSTVPLPPAGLEAEIISGGSTIRLSWSGVTRNENGSSCTDLALYRIYRASFIDGVYEQKGTVLAGASTEWPDPENIKGKVFYYIIRAEDVSGNESGDSMAVDSSVGGNIISKTANNNILAYIKIPQLISGKLLKDNNDYKEDLWVRVTGLSKNDYPGALAVCRIEVVRGAGNVVENFSFDSPLASIVMQYEVQDGYVVEAASIAENEAAENLAIFWFNGLQWIKLGGETDEFNHTLSVNSSRLGLYTIMKSPKSESFVIESIQPDKIFTPNNDGWNDYIQIQFSNPNAAYVEAAVYGINGIKVADLEVDMENETVTWRGIDGVGNVVPGGVYIYQLRVTGSENKIINGTVVVAK